MSAAATAWQALRDALKRAEPACMGDDRFTADTSDHDAVLREICAACPIQPQCRDYGKVAPRNGAWGFYGGVVRRTKPQMRPRRRASDGVPG